MNRSFSAVSILVLLLSACAPSAGEWGEETEFVNEELAASTGCVPGYVGTVGLEISGNPGDAFRISLTCDGSTVATCSAVIVAGATAASCLKGPEGVVEGPVRCVTQPGNGNSAAANIDSSACY